MAPSVTSLLNHDYNSNEISNNLLSVGLASNHGKEYGKRLTENELKGRVNRIDTDNCNAGEEDAFFVADVGEVYRQHLRWKMNLKRVKPHYGEHGKVSRLTKIC